MNQVLGARELTLNIFFCEASDVFCGVHVDVKNKTGDKFAHLYPIQRAVYVLRKLLVNEKNALKSPVSPLFSKGWKGQCMGRFCVAVSSNLTTYPELKMNLPDARFQKSLIEFNEFNSMKPGKAFPVTNMAMFPILYYKCDSNLNCPSKFATHKGNTSYFDIPSMFYTNEWESKLRWVAALNGFGACFDTYCYFMDEQTLKVKANFDGNKYYNVVPEPLKLNKTHHVDTKALMEMKIIPQIEVEIGTDARNSSSLEFTYQEAKDPEDQGAFSLRFSLPIPKGFDQTKLSPVRQFKATNGVGVCAGFYCCFKRTNEINFLMNFKGKFPRSFPPVPWYGHKATLEFEVKN